MKGKKLPLSLLSLSLSSFQLHPEMIAKVVAVFVRSVVALSSGEGGRGALIYSVGYTWLKGEGSIVF